MLIVDKVADSISTNTLSWRIPHSPFIEILDTK